MKTTLSGMFVIFLNVCRALAHIYGEFCFVLRMNVNVNWGSLAAEMHPRFSAFWLYFSALYPTCGEEALPSEMKRFWRDPPDTVDNWIRRVLFVSCVPTFSLLVFLLCLLYFLQFRPRTLITLCLEASLLMFSLV